MSFCTRYISSTAIYASLSLAILACGPALPSAETAGPVVKSKQHADFVHPAVKEPAFLSEFAPYFAELNGGEAAQLLAEDKLVDALTAFDEIILSCSDIELTPRARFVAGYIAERIGDDERAVKELTYTAEELPMTADLAWERAGRAALRLGRCEDAATFAGKVSPSSVFSSDALMTRADALRLLEKYTAAVDAYRTYLAQWPKGNRRREAESRIVQCTALQVEDTHDASAPAKKSIPPEKLEFGLAVLHRMQAASPTGYWTRQAESFEEALMGASGLEVPQDRPARRIALDAYEKAQNLKNKMKNEAAERAYNEVIRLTKRNPDLQCRARFEQAITVQQQRDYGRAAELYDGVAADCRDPGVRIRSMYRGAKCFDSSGKTEEAIRLFEQVEAEFPNHSYADDARLRAAKCYLDIGDKAKFHNLLATLPSTYPSGDMRAEALWILSLDALDASDWTAAKETLEPYYAMFPNEKGWYSAGRSGYWLGRTEENLGDELNAALHYEHVIATAPFSFYMVLAYNRLAALNPKQAQKLIATLAPAGAPAELKFRRELLTEYPAFASALELHRLGLVSCAKNAFDHLLNEPNLPAELHWIVAALQRRAGRYAEAKETAVADGDWQSRYPVGEDLLPWTLAYPTVFEETVQNAAEASDVSPQLIWAIMREESGFNVKIESWANALGLMQLILPTARAMGKKLGITVNRRNLRTPEVNIPLGTAYLSHLNGLFDNHPTLTVAGYNAGEGAVARWLKDRTNKDVDLFVEQIPYDQTRGYTKRVLGTLATYMFLYTEDRKILELPLTVP